MIDYQNIRLTGGDTGAKLNIQRRFAFLNQYLNLENKSILDCGCGTGDYILNFLKYSPHVYGVEYQEDKILTARSRGIPPDHIQHGDIEFLNFESNTFDFILVNEVLEHVPDDRQALREIYRVLKPGGFFALFSPNRLYPFETHGVALKNSSTRIPLSFPFIPYLPHNLAGKFLTYFARNYFPWELKKMVVETGFQIIKQTAIWQTFENISGNSPKVMTWMSPILRALSFTLEKIPLFKFLGVSQVIVSKKSITNFVFP